MQKEEMKRKVKERGGGVEGKRDVGGGEGGTDCLKKISVQ